MCRENKIQSRLEIQKGESQGYGDSETRIDQKWIPRTLFHGTYSRILI